MHGRVHGTSMAVHTGRKGGRLDGRVYGTRPVRPCIRYVHGWVRAAYPAVFCHVPAAYTAVFRTRTDHAHGPCTAVNSLYTAEGGRHSLYTAAHGRVQTVYTAVHGPSTWSVRDPITAVFTARVHGIVRTVYTTVHGVYGSGTPGTLYTALFKARVQGRSRQCTDCVHGRAWATYMVRP